MTRDRARKKAIRARMAASGESYSVAARKVAAAAPADGEAVEEIIARANSTLAARSARVGFRIDTDVVMPERPGRNSPGPAGRLARLAARAVWEHIAPGVDVAELRDAFAHQACEGFVEPAADRYMIDYGHYAVMCMAGKYFGGASGHPLQARHRDRRRGERLDDPLRLLRLLQGATDARYVSDTALRGTPCRALAVRPGPPELTVWIDDHHIRRIQFQERASSRQSSLSKNHALELWDFGVPVDGLDWSRLPSFHTPE